MALMNKRAMSTPCLTAANALKLWKNGPRVTSPVSGNVIALSPRNWTSLPIRNKRLVSSVSTMDLISKSHGTKNCTAVKAILQSAHKSREEKHGTDKAASSSATTSEYQTSTRKGSVLKSPGMVRLKTNICKPSSRLPLRRLRRSTLLRT